MREFKDNDQNTIKHVQISSDIHQFIKTYKDGMTARVAIHKKRVTRADVIEAFSEQEEIARLKEEGIY